MCAADLFHLPLELTNDCHVMGYDFGIVHDLSGNHPIPSQGSHGTIQRCYFKCFPNSHDVKTLGPRCLPREQ
jgi:hypothetical protein